MEKILAAARMLFLFMPASLSKFNILLITSHSTGQCYDKNLSDNFIRNNIIWQSGWEGENWDQNCPIIFMYSYISIHPSINPLIILPCLLLNCTFPFCTLIKTQIFNLADF